MKKQKGMTLMEVVISIAIYGILALLVTEIMTTVNATMRATNQLNDRISYERKYADNNVPSNIDAEHVSNVTYDIHYGYALDDETLAAPTAKVIAPSEVESDPTGEAIEYMLDYSDPLIHGTNFADNVNFRFMSFDKTSLEASSKPGDTFQVYIRFVPYFTTEVPSTLSARQEAIRKANTALPLIGNLSVEAGAGANFDGTTDTTISFDGPFTLGSYRYLDIVNYSPDDLDSATQKQVSAKFMFSSTKDPYGDGLQRAFSESDVEVFLFVQMNENKNSATYYNGCVIEYNVNTGEFMTRKSIVAGQSLYTDTEEIVHKYDVIMAAE